MRLAQPEMTATKQRSYLQKVLKDAESRRKTVTVRKSNATKALKAGKITAEQRDLIHKNVGKLEREIRDYRKHYESKLKVSKVQVFVEVREDEEPIFLMMQKKCCKS